MRLSENRTLAWIVLAVCVFGSVAGLGGMHLQSKRSDVLHAFYDGVDTGSENRSMDALLDQAADCARMMACEAQIYLGRQNAHALNMLDGISTLCSDAALDERYNVYTKLRQDSDALYNAMYSVKLLDGERVKFKRAYDEFWHCDKHIRRDPYRDLAAAYNESIASFPASAVAAMVGAGELSCFGA